ncbi:MAG: MerR family transcriptional regulator [Alphaproteobacteria bacterium]|nr:MerR family transcriptional regulator [Alphaproteobacteria bacterium]
MVVNKSKSAFKTIAEVAEELGVATHVLRFWETKFNQIRPMKASGGRRYYRPDDVEVLKLIKGLLYGSRYTIEGAQHLIKERGLKKLLGDTEIQKDFFTNPNEEIAVSDENIVNKSLDRNALKEISDAINELKSLKAKLGGN